MKKKIFFQAGLSLLLGHFMLLIFLKWGKSPKEALVAYTLKLPIHFMFDFWDEKNETALILWKSHKLGETPFLEKVISLKKAENNPSEYWIQVDREQMQKILPRLDGRPFWAMPENLPPSEVDRLILKQQNHLKESSYEIAF